MARGKGLSTNRNEQSRVLSRGTYALVLFLPRAHSIRVGKLGAFKFPRGYCVYVGSALNRLAQRISRHLRSDKRRFWHVDYFLEYAQVKRIWTRQGAERLECLRARAAFWRK